MRQTALHGHGDVATIEGSGDANPRCMWDESVCLQSPDRFIVFAGAGDGSAASTFCGRHYVLTLEYLRQVHLPHCPESHMVSHHIVRWGTL
jgi:hypothetical protein